MNPKGHVVLVTGTGTEVGKTFVTCALAHRLTQAGRRVVALKPVESGCPPQPAPTEDGALLAKATGQSAPLFALDRLSAPLAPPEAADQEGAALSFDRWADHIVALAKDYEIVLVEGAGGLLSPLTWERTALDLAKTCHAHALIVAEDKLGTLNHCLLTLKVLEDAQVSCLGVVFNTPNTVDRSSGLNPTGLKRFAKTTRVATLSRHKNINVAAEELTSVFTWIEP